MNKTILAEYKEFKDEYAYNPDIFCKDDERVKAVKRIISKDLTAWERTFILCYAELQSVRKLGEKFGVSRQTAWTLINGIQKKIKAKL